MESGDKNVGFVKVPVWCWNNTCGRAWIYTAQCTFVQKTKRNFSKIHLELHEKNGMEGEMFTALSVL